MKTLEDTSLQSVEIIENKDRSITKFFFIVILLGLPLSMLFESTKNQSGELSFEVSYVQASQILDLIENEAYQASQEDDLQRAERAIRDLKANKIPDKTDLDALRRVALIAGDAKIWLERLAEYLLCKTKEIAQKNIEDAWIHDENPIKLLRRRKGLNQKTLAGIAEVDNTMLNRSENGKAQPSEGFWEKISKALNVEAEWLKQKNEEWLKNKK